MSSALFARWGLTAAMRAALRTLARKGVEGVGRGDGVAPPVLNALVSRSCATFVRGPADRPGAWRYLITDDGREVAGALGASDEEIAA